MSKLHDNLHQVCVAWTKTVVIGKIKKYLSTVYLQVGKYLLFFMVKPTDPEFSDLIIQILNQVFFMKKFCVRTVRKLFQLNEVLC